MMFNKYHLNNNQSQALRLIEDSQHDQHRIVFVQSYQSISWKDVELLQDICEIICLEFFAQDYQKFSLFFIGENTLVIILHNWKNQVDVTLFTDFLLRHLSENLPCIRWRAEAYYRIPALNILMHLKFRFEENYPKYAKS